MKQKQRKLTSGFRVRNCQYDDVDDIIKIVNSKNNRASFGWLQKVVLQAAIDNQQTHGLKSRDCLRVVVQKTPQGERVVAFIRLYHRLDGQTTLHEIGVAEDCQNRGIGSFLVEESIVVCRKRKMQKIHLKTPVGIKSNSFYPRFQFCRVGVYPGRIRKLNIYERNL
jgi:ribosomal protein S18 acetylase RimI-like enzyme